MKIPCSVGILTKNSAQFLSRALESVKEFDDIVVCDGGSTDATLEIARSYGARIIYQNTLYLDTEGYIQNFSGVRNQLVEAARYEWFFWIDSDEYASGDLISLVRDIVQTRDRGAFNVYRRYMLGDKEVTCCTTYPNRSLRLFSKKSVSGFRKIVHERPELRDGTIIEDLDAKVYVPVAEDRDAVRKRNDRYIALEVKRKGYVGVFKFLAYARGEFLISMLYLFRLLKIILFCRGVRLPISMELARHVYTIRVLKAIWRARRETHPPHVLFFINKWKIGGAEIVTKGEFESMKESGVGTSFGVAYGSEVPQGFEERAITPCFQSPLDVAAYIKFVRYINDRGVTHIVSTLEHANIIARIAGILSPRIKVVIIESGMADRKPLRYKLLDLLLNWKTRAIVSGSTGVQRSLAYQSIYQRKMRVLLNGVNVPIQMQGRQEPERFTVLAVGSLRKEKGFDVLLDAFATFSKARNAELLIIGKGGLESQLKQQGNRLALNGKVTFLGEVSHDEVLSLFRSVHCFVLSSISEGNPTVVMEALASGTPVLSTRVSGVTDYVEDGVSGLLVPIGDARSLSEGLERLYADANLRKKLGDGGYECARSRLTFVEHMKGLTKILEI